MTLSARIQAPLFIQRAKTQTLRLPVYTDGEPVTITSGTITIYDESGNKKVDTAAITVDSDGYASYSLSSATIPVTLEPAEDWHVEWVLLIDSETHTFRQDAALVIRLLYPVITDVDLRRCHADLSNLLPPNKSSWQDYIDEAWDRITHRLLEQGRRPYLIMSPWSLREVHLNLTLALIMTDLETYSTGRGKYAELADRYHKAFEERWGKLTFTYDASHENDMTSATEGESATPIIWLA